MNSSRIFNTLWMVVKTIPSHLSRNRYFTVASALSFSSVLAVVPFMTVVISSLSLFPLMKSQSSTIQDFIYRNFMPEIGDQIQVYLQEFSANAGQLTLWGLIFLLATTLMLLATIEDAFNNIWNVENGRPIGQRILVYWAMLTLGPLMIAISLSVSSYLISLSILQGQEVVVSAKSQFLRALPIILQLASFVFFYFSVPNCEVRLKHALIGGLVATFLFELAKYGFAQYLGHFAAYQRIYGALAIIPVFLIWIYLSWLVVLIGAYIAAAFGNHSLRKQASDDCTQNAGIPPRAIGTIE